MNSVVSLQVIFVRLTNRSYICIFKRQNDEMKYIVLATVQKNFDIIYTISSDSNVFPTIIVQIFKDDSVRSRTITQWIPCLVCESCITITVKNTHIVCTDICDDNIPQTVIIQISNIDPIWYRV